MSDIVLARELLKEARSHLREGQKLVDEALTLMVRVPHIRQARPKYVKIDDELRERVKRLAARYPNWTTQEIAVRCGLRSGGRVSEILHNHR